MNSVLQTSFNTIKGGQVQNLVPLQTKPHYLSHSRPFAAFSDFLWMICNNHVAEALLYEQFDAAPDEVSMEIFCDQETCDLFLSWLSDIAEEAQAWDCHLSFSEISYRATNDSSQTNFVITITGNWTISIEAYNGKWLPCPSAMLVAYGNAGEFDYFADANMQDAIQNFDYSE